MAQKKRAPARTKPAVIIPALTPPRGSPFAGISKTGAPARETQIPHLTAQVQIAKARQERLNQGGLLTPQQRAQEQRAAKTLAKPEKRDSVTAPKRSARTTPSQSTPPLVLGAPPAALSAALPNSTPARTPRPPARRGAPLTPRQQLQAKQPGQGSLIGDISGAYTGLHHAGQAIDQAVARGSNELAAKAYGLGAKSAGKIPTSFDVVAPAGAATTGPVTKSELAKLEAQGYDLKPSLRARFMKNAAKNGWNPAELDGLSGSALIDKAFTKPAWGPLRVGANFAGGVAKLGTLPAGIEGAVRETLAGHGREVGTALGEGLISEVPFIGKHKTTDTAVADPFGFITQFAGVGKTVGAAGRLGKVGNVAREVETASSGLKVARGMRDPNAYVATGQMLSDKAAASIPRIGRRLEAEVVDKSVRRVTNKHAPAFVKVQRPYKQALDKVGHKRAAELSGYQMAGGKPEQLAAFYRAQGNADNAKFFDNVAKNTQTLTEKDHAFLDAHRALASKTTQAHMDIGKFGPTASQFRAYSPLIRSAAHLGSPEAQRVLALRDEYLKGFNTMPEQDLAALRGAIDQGVEDFAAQHKAGSSKPIPVPGRREVSPDEMISARNSSRETGLVADSGRALGPDDWVTLYHATTPEVAAAAVQGGFKLGGKVSKKAEPITDPTVAKMLGKEVGDVPDYEIGRGMGQGVYLARSEADVEQYGSAVLAVRVQVKDLGLPPERKVMARHGEKAPSAALLVGDGYVEKPIPAANVSLHSAPTQGGIDPTYVEYSQPRPLIAPPYKPGPGGATGFKKPRGRQKAETGASFESGKYLIDPKAPLMESVRAQRAHLADVLHEDVSKSIGQHLTAGDPIPDGHVFVSETNLRGLRRTTNDLTDNPVSQPAYDEFASQKQGIFDRLTGAAVPSGERVPRGQKGYAIPEGAWRRILDHTRPPSKTAWDKFMRQYQRVLVSYRPSTIVNNTIGSMPLAMTGGAITPTPWIKAAQAMRDPSLAPAILRGHGVAGSMAPSVRSKVGAGMDFMRAQSARGEDFSRLATYFAKAGPTLKKRAAELEMSTDGYQRALAAGDVDPQRLDAFIDHAEKFVGDVVKPDGPLGRFASHGILFHRWLGHIAKLLLFTLPVKHPRRLAILNELSDYGDQYRQEHGVWPDWYREYLPLFQHVKRVGRTGQPQVFTKAYSTQGVNPFSTLNQYANPVSTNDSVKNLLLGVLAPTLQVPIKTIFDRPYDSKSSIRYLAGQSLRQFPGVTVVRPQGGMSPDSIPFFSEQQKVYSSGHKRHGKTVPLPWDFRPVARAEPGVLGALLRYGLGGVYDVPAQGPVHSIDQKKHIGAMAKAARR